ncbi:PAS domain S-box protein [Ramlibacter sp. G-1-2-2]|uniref:PAS domain S-box protein n=2 Tax=Ramlibacter agri TaxID=2728837 RepID=A0A848HFE1_9BURK|nr:PAS domain S-box protein [Ramlibacter agri]
MEQAWCLPQAVLDQAAEAIIFADREGRIQLWNRGAEVLFGYAPREAVGQSLDIIIPERFRPAHNQGFREAMASGQLRAANRVRTTRAIDKFGGRIYVEISFFLVKDPAGGVVGAGAIGRDVTQAFLEKQAALTRAGASPA